MKIKTQINNLNNYKKYLKIEQATHEFLQKKGYLKVDLPVLSPALIPESYLEIFETEFNFLGKKERLYLTPSPELFQKRLLVYGIGNCYYLGKAFRNSEPNSSWHLSEFTMLEFYKLGVSYLELADEILDLLQFIAQTLYQKNVIYYKNNLISLDKWEKKSVAQVFLEYTHINEQELYNPELFIKKSQTKGYKTENFSYEDLFSQIFTQEIEPNLGVNGYPTLIYDYPKELASLAKMNDNGFTAKRCEFYINGLEIGGFCTELNNYTEQERRFFNESKKRHRQHLINHTVDNGFIEALQYGLPDCTGAGIGFERLAMIFTNLDSINELKLITFE